MTLKLFGILVSPPCVLCSFLRGIDFRFRPSLPVPLLASGLFHDALNCHLSLRD